MMNNSEEQLIKEPQREVIKRRVKDMVDSAKDHDTILFLDKSARPLSTAFLTEWRIQHPDEEPPNIRFLNIGIEKIPVIVKWAEKHIPKKDGEKYIIESIISEETLSDVFGSENVNTLKHVIADAKDLMIVDDLSHSGRSMRLAEAVVKSIKPNVEIDPFFLLNTDDDKKTFTEKTLPFLPWKGATGVEDPSQDEPDPYSQFGNENKKGFLVKPLSPEKVELRKKSRNIRQELRKIMLG